MILVRWPECLQSDTRMLQDHEKRQWTSEVCLLVLERKLVLAKNSVQVIQVKRVSDGNGFCW